MAAVTVIAAACGSQSPAATTAQKPGGIASWAAVMAGSHDLGPVRADQALSVALNVRPPRAAQQEAALKAIYDPASPTFGQYLTPAEYNALYGVQPDRIAQLRASVQPMGLDLTWQPGSTGAVLSGPGQAFQRALRITVDNYRSSDGTRFYAGSGAPTLPQPLRDAVDRVDRVTDWSAPIKRLPRPQAVPKGGLRPQDVATAYDTKPLRDAGIDGTGQTVVVWALGDSFAQSDFDGFNQQFGLPPSQPKVVGPAGGQSEGEIIMDIEAIHAVAPGASIVVYTAPYNSDSDIMAAQQQMVNDNPGAIISQSWGGCESGWGAAQLKTWTQLSDKAAQTGSTLFFSSGDSGGYECMQRGASQPRKSDIGVSMPASLPGVTAVGGTLLSITSSGGWHGEVPWKGQTNMEGTGGGISAKFPMPDYQKKAFGTADSKNNPDSMRGVPDVSAIGDPESGLAILSSGQWSAGGGTSLSSPLWAGFTALINQYLQKQGAKPVGFFNPALYQIGGGSKQPYPAFHDLTKSGNMAYPAQPGYDLASGLGTPDVWNLARDEEQYQKKGGR